MTIIAENMNEDLGVGMNIEHSTDTEGEGDNQTQPFLTNGFIEDIAAAGFKSVRLPIYFASHASVDEGNIDESFFKLSDKAIQRVLDLGMKVILDLHGYELIMDDPEGQFDRFIYIWDQITRHYIDWSSDLIFEILNEPTNKLSPETPENNTTLWNDYCSEAISTIRKYDNSRVVLIDVDHQANFQYLKYLDVEMVKSDPAAIVTLHFYYPENFTFWGYDGKAGEDWCGWYGEKTYISDRLDIISEWQEENNIPICIGEFGCCKNESPQLHRMNWVGYIRSECQKRGFSCLYWELYQAFGIYDRNTGEWDEGILEALGFLYVYDFSSSSYLDLSTPISVNSGEKVTCIIKTGSRTGNNRKTLFDSESEDNRITVQVDPSGNWVIIGGTATLDGTAISTGDEYIRDDSYHEIVFTSTTDESNIKYIGSHYQINFFWHDVIREFSVGDSFYRINEGPDANAVIVDSNEHVGGAIQNYDQSYWRNIEPGIQTNAVDPNTDSLC